MVKKKSTRRFRWAFVEGRFGIEISSTVDIPEQDLTFLLGQCTEILKRQQAAWEARLERQEKGEGNEPCLDRDDVSTERNPEILRRSIGPLPSGLIAGYYLEWNGPSKLLADAIREKHAKVEQDDCFKLWVYDK